MAEKRAGGLGWRPQYPQGRDVVLCANDCTVKRGSFATREDDFFRACAEYAVEHRLPFLYCTVRLFPASEGATIQSQRRSAEALYATGKVVKGGLFQLCWSRRSEEGGGCVQCNAGATLGLAEELKELIRVEWENEDQPSLGFRCDSC